jgi:uncharacterized Fe-S cluster-containing radical SAM superfamily protein
MFRLFNIKFPHYAPPDSQGGIESGKELGKEEIINLLGEDDDKEEILDLKDEKKIESKEEEGDEEKEEEGEEKKDELEEIEDELEEPDEEKLELMTPVRRKEILSKYPNVFKDFPYLERAYYREQQFTEIFPTIADARSSVEKSEALDSLEKELLSGDTKNILKAIKEENSDSFNKLVDNYLPNLAEIDEKAYHHVIGNTIRHTIVAMLTEARDSQNKETAATLQDTAAILNQFVFGSSIFTKPSNLSKEGETKKDDDKVSERERQFTQRQFESAKDDLNTRVNNIIRATIDGHIDPKESMTNYVRKNASREALETLSDLIDKDSRFKTLADRLWEKAFQSDFSKESLDKIRSAYLAKSKTLLPSVIKKARNEALKGLGKHVSDDEKDRKGPVLSGKESSHRSSPRNDKEKSQKIPANMRSIDYLMQD